MQKKRFLRNLSKLFKFFVKSDQVFRKQNDEFVGHKVRQVSHFAEPSNLLIFDVLRKGYLRFLI